jgi:membrane protease YdiL (CAAX protease family)
MSSFQIPTWFKYSLALAVAILLGTVSAIPDLALASPQDSGWNPLVGIMHAVIVGAAFSLIVFTETMWSNRARSNLRQSTFRRIAFVFLVFAGGEFALELLMRPFFSELSRHEDLQNALAHMVQAGNGWLLPMMFLGVFIVIILFRSHREH